MTKLCQVVADGFCQPMVPLLCWPAQDTHSNSPVSQLYSAKSLVKELQELCARLEE